MTDYTIKIIRGQYKNKGIVYIVDIRSGGNYYGAWLFDGIEETLDFIRKCDGTKYGLPEQSKDELEGGDNGN